MKYELKKRIGHKVQREKPGEPTPFFEWNRNWSTGLRGRMAHLLNVPMKSSRDGRCT